MFYRYMPKDGSFTANNNVLKFPSSYLSGFMDPCIYGGLNIIRWINSLWLHISLEADSGLDVFGVK